MTVSGRRQRLARRLGTGLAAAVLAASVVGFSSSAVAAAPTSFLTPGIGQTFVVPSGVTAVAADVFGAQGGATVFTTTQTGGLGGELQATICVTPGETLTVDVGGVGHGGFGTSGDGAGGVNGGGAGGLDGGTDLGGAGGGGASEVIRSGAKVLIAGAGGGAGSAGIGGGPGGAGGATNGTAGGNGPGNGGGGGGGATSIGPGAAGTGGGLS